MSLLVPALLTNLNDSSNGDREIAFMQIDCEVIDTRLLNLKFNDIPFDFMKIMHQDYVNEQQQSYTGNNNY